MHTFVKKILNNTELSLYQKLYNFVKRNSTMLLTEGKTLKTFLS